MRNAVIRIKIKNLKNLSKYERGSKEWLIKCEVDMGGYVSNIPRDIVSILDHRSIDQLKHGGMIGGDRMIYNNYAKFYSRHLDRFIKFDQKKLVIVECGILKGTGLAMWSILFPKAKIIGLDIDVSNTRNNLINLKNSGAFKYNDPFLINFDQLDPMPYIDDLVKVLGSNEINIFIDDGLHSRNSILNTFNELEKFLHNDSVYFIEDNGLIHEDFKKINHGSKLFHYGRLTVLEK